MPLGNAGAVTEIYPKSDRLLDLNHLKIFLTDAAVGADPVIRHVIPACAGCYAVIGPAFGLVVYQSTNNTFPLFHRVVINQVGARVVAVCYAESPESIDIFIGFARDGKDTTRRADIFVLCRRSGQPGKSGTLFLDH